MPSGTRIIILSDELDELPASTLQLSPPQSWNSIPHGSFPRRVRSQRAIATWCSSKVFMKKAIPATFAPVERDAVGDALSVPSEPSANAIEVYIPA